MKRESIREVRAAERVKIIDKSVEIFWRDGYQFATMDEISIATGVSKPAIYRHFYDKQDLYVSILSYYKEYFVEHLRGRVDSLDALPADKIYKLSEELTYLAMTHPYSYSMLLRKDTYEFDEAREQACSLKDYISLLSTMILEDYHKRSYSNRNSAFTVRFFVDILFSTSWVLASSHEESYEECCEFVRRMTDGAIFSENFKNMIK